MQGILATIQQWHIHPFVDHFTVAILILAVVTDLLASLFSTRLWLRYAALAMIIVAAGAAWGSSVTGGWEADKVWKAVKANGGPAFAILQRHAELGEDILPWAVLVLAVWRIGIQFLGFMAGSRALYLLLAVLALIAVSYQGYLGGEMVYDYGVGTALFPAGTPSPSPAAVETPSGPVTPIPTVFVPTASATPEAGGGAATAGATATTAPAAAPTATQSATPSASPQPSATATPASSASGADDLKTSNAPPASPGTTIRPPDPHPAATSL